MSRGVVRACMRCCHSCKAYSISGKVPSVDERFTHQSTHLQLLDLLDQAEHTKDTEELERRQDVTQIAECHDHAESYHKEIKHAPRVSKVWALDIFYLEFFQNPIVAMPNGRVAVNLPADDSKGIDLGDRLYHVDVNEGKVHYGLQFVVPVLRWYVQMRSESFHRV